MTDATSRITVNGRELECRAAAHLSLLRWLRDHVGALEVKYGCGEGVCGACAVLIDGQAVNSCLVLAAQIDGRAVTTSAGLGSPSGGLGRLQQAFLDRGAAQCGFCTGGMLVTAAEFAGAGEALDRRSIRDALHGNLCRCTGYQAIVDAVDDVLRDQGSSSPPAGGWT